MKNTKKETYLVRFVYKKDLGAELKKLSSYLKNGAEINCFSLDGDIMEVCYKLSDVPK